MKQKAGMWIDHRQAYVVYTGDGAKPPERIGSGMEKHVRFSGHAAMAEGSADNQRDRQFEAHLGRYYDEVIAHVRDAESILLFGPGEAKGEFRKHLVSKGLGARVVGCETVDKMSDKQIVAKVRNHFEK